MSTSTQLGAHPLTKFITMSPKTETSRPAKDEDAMRRQHSWPGVVDHFDDHALRRKLVGNRCLVGNLDTVWKANERNEMRSRASPTLPSVEVSFPSTSPAHWHRESQLLAKDVVRLQLQLFTVLAQSGLSHSGPPLHEGAKVDANRHLRKRWFTPLSIAHSASAPGPNGEG